jgi:phage-related protein
VNQKNLDILKHFVGFCKKELEIQSLPKISLVKDRSFVEMRRSFGEYNPGEMTVKVFITGRNLADVCRSLAHELVHHRQQELNLIYSDAGETGTEIENDANAIAGIIMREYGKLNLSVYNLDVL